jgi:hypothetical protein
MWKLVSQWHIQICANSELYTKSILDNFNEAVLRRIVHNFYLTEKQQPTRKAILRKMWESIGYRGVSSL